MEKIYKRFFWEEILLNTKFPCQSRNTHDDFHILFDTQQLRLLTFLNLKCRLNDLLF